MALFNKHALKLLIAPAIVILIYSGYGVWLWRDANLDELKDITPIIVGLLLLLFFSGGATHVLLARGSGLDERNGLIALLGAARGGLALTVGVVTVIISALFGASPFILVHLLLASLVLAELAALMAMLPMLRKRRRVRLWLAFLEGEAPPWKPQEDEAVELRPGLFLIRTAKTRSRLYHDIKHAARPDSLLVAALDGEPKFKGMAAGALKWLRAGGS